MKEELLLRLIAHEAGKQVVSNMLIEGCVIDEIGRDYIRIITKYILAETILKNQKIRSDIEIILNDSNLFILPMTLVVTYMEGYTIPKRKHIITKASIDFDCIF